MLGEGMRHYGVQTRDTLTKFVSIVWIAQADRVIAHVQVASEANSANPADPQLGLVYFEHHRAYILYHALRTPVRVEEIQQFG